VFGLGPGRIGASGIAEKLSVLFSKIIVAIEKYVLDSFYMIRSFLVFYFLF